MALKFLNKKGWHTGSLRNIENVWKAEQKQEAEQKKLEELRKQIHEERERNEFRLLQEQAGLLPKQERLEFLYDSGLSVGKSDGGGASASGSGSGFKALEQPSLASSATATATANAKQQSSAPGALFEDKPQSASDAWRKLHSDPLLLIRQREQETLSRLKNNPVKMAMIQKSVEEKKHKEKSSDKKERKKKHHSSSKQRRHSSSKQQSDSEDSLTSGLEKPRKNRNKKRSYHDVHHYKRPLDSGDESFERKGQKKSYLEDSKFTERNDPENEKYSSKGQKYCDADRKGRGKHSISDASSASRKEIHHKRRPKLSEEELAARLQEMQENAELHEQQRWKRLRKAEEDDAREATRGRVSSGGNFLEAAKKSVFGAERGGSSTIEESVRRRTHYLQGRSEASEGNAFRR